MIFEGPGGRIPLTRWTLRRDPANRGLALGWRKGGFGGTTVSVPNVVHPAPYSGKAGGASTMKARSRGIGRASRRPGRACTR